MKQRLKFFWRVPYQIFLALFLISAVVTVMALRSNNQHMVKLRDAVYAADKNGSGVEAALNNLRAYVYTHMNTNLSSGNGIKPPIQLKYTYDRLVAAEQEKAKATNSQIYTDAQNYCQSLNSADFSGRNRVPCVQQYVTSHGVAIATIPTGLYQFDFLNPAWSPDFAGWSLVVSTFLFAAFVASFSHRSLKKHGHL